MESQIFASTAISAMIVFVLAKVRLPVNAHIAERADFAESRKMVVGIVKMLMMPNACVAHNTCLF
jgi:hypothetical protein